MQRYSWIRELKGNAWHLERCPLVQSPAVTRQPTALHAGGPASGTEHAGVIGDALQRAASRRKHDITQLLGRHVLLGAQAAIHRRQRGLKEAREPQPVHLQDEAERIDCRPCTR